MQNYTIDEHRQENMFNGLCCMQAQILMNLYATENAALRLIKPNKQLPYNAYINDLGLQTLAQYFNIGQIDGPMIEHGHIKKLTYDEICFELYKDKIDFIFYEAPKYSDSYTDYDDDIYHYKHGLYEYLKELYKLFHEIIAVDVPDDFFSTIPTTFDRSEQHAYYTKIIRFVTAIKLKHLRQGSCVDRYVKDLTIISQFVQRLLKVHNGRYILANNDTDSLDYKLALLSCFRFYNEYNAQLFKLKMLQWEELNR